MEPSMLSPPHLRVGMMTSYTEYDLALQVELATAATTVVSLNSLARMEVCGAGGLP